MARTKESKKEILSSLGDKLDKSMSVVFASFKGLKVKDSEVLRREARANDLECMMAKKTLLSRVFHEKGMSEVDFKGLEGEIVATFSYGDEVAPARVLSKFAKDHEQLKIVGGLMVSAPEGSRFMDAKAVTQLAKLPSRDELRAQLLALFMAPASGLVRLMNEPSSQFVRVLQAKTQK